MANKEELRKQAEEQGLEVNDSMTKAQIQEMLDQQNLQQDEMGSSDIEPANTPLDQQGVDDGSNVATEDEMLAAEQTNSVPNPLVVSADGQGRPFTPELDGKTPEEQEQKQRDNDFPEESTQPKE